MKKATEDKYPAGRMLAAMAKVLPVPSEHQEQCTFFDYIEVKAQQYPELKLAFAIPNGSLRHKQVGRKLKREGVRAGVPDIFIPAAREINGKWFYGCFIEMKSCNPKSRLSPVQKEMIENLQNYGYRCIVGRGWVDAWLQLRDFLDGSE
jgi:hypothetical protein